MIKIGILLIASLGIMSCTTSSKEVDANKSAVPADSIAKQEEPIRADVDSNQRAIKKLDEFETFIHEFPELQDYQVYSEHKPYYLEGDFFGDGIQDLAILIQRQDSVKLSVIDFSKNGKTVHILGEDGEFESDYSWIGDFEKVKAGEVLWSNYEDDFRSLEDVPEEEKVYLTYNAIFVHAPESCGGGFIFWKDGKFNWLQQE
ncbi:hypothetical protein [Sphingobacterium hungaricum]